MSKILSIQIYFKLSFKKVIKVLKSVFLSETVKRFLFPDWAQSIDVLPDR